VKIGHAYDLFAYDLYFLQILIIVGLMVFALVFMVRGRRTFDERPMVLAYVPIFLSSFALLFYIMGSSSRLNYYEEFDSGYFKESFFFSMGFILLTLGSVFLLMKNLFLSRTRTIPMLLLGAVLILVTISNVLEYRNRTGQVENIHQQVEAKWEHLANDSSYGYSFNFYDEDEEEDEYILTFEERVSFLNQLYGNSYKYSLWQAFMLAAASVVLFMGASHYKKSKIQHDQMKKRREERRERKEDEEFRKSREPKRPVVEDDDEEEEEEVYSIFEKLRKERE